MPSGDDAAPAEPRDAEPVAWRWKWKSDFFFGRKSPEWNYCHRAPEYRAEDREVEPLYIAPRLVSDDALDAGRLNKLPGATTGLWCMHVIGPDDVLAASSYADAVARCNRTNEETLRWREASTQVEDWPFCIAIPAPWPHSAEAHAKHLKAETALQTAGGAQHG